MVNNTALNQIAAILRRDVLKMTSKAGSGHPTTCLSCAEIMSVLFFQEMRYDVTNPFNPDNDEFILSKGHAAPILYSCLYRAGAVKEDLLNLRNFGSSYEGHPNPISLKWVKVATGSLGQGFSIGIGMALAAKLQKKKYRTYVLMGDSECAEGSIYEACQVASHYKLNNLCAIIDINRLGQSGETMLGHNIQAYKKRFVGFNLNVITVDGHNIKEISAALKKAKKETKKPTIILAKTFKGKGVSFLENKENWHGKALNQEQLEKALQEIPDPKLPKINIQKPEKTRNNFKSTDFLIKTTYKETDLVATREAYGKALVKLALQDERIIATDAETKNSTFSEELLKAKPANFIECYIAEQNMAGIALGLAVKGFNVFASSFAAFLSRAHDQIRMAAISNTDITFCGSHCGISIGEDGASQMALEDIALFRSLPDSSVFYPSDAVSTEKLVELASKTKGIKYLRTTRAKTPIIYSNNDDFPRGEFKILKSSPKDKVVIVGAGITLHEALKAYECLKKEGINVCIVDCYCVKPFDQDKFKILVKKSGGKVLVVEDHYPEGGIGEMIASVVSDSFFLVKSLAVRKIPHSGKPEELLKIYGINHEAIIESVKTMIFKNNTI